MKPISMYYDPQIEEMMSSMVVRVSCRNSEILRVGHWGLIHVMKQHTRRCCSTRTVGKNLACPTKSQDKGKHMKMFNIFPINIWMLDNTGQKEEMPWEQLPALAGEMCGSIRFFSRGQKRCMSGSRHHSLVVWNDVENGKNYQDHRPF